MRPNLMQQQGKEIGNRKGSSRGFNPDVYEISKGKTLIRPRLSFFL
jgi:hypothetical protein